MKKITLFWILIFSFQVFAQTDVGSINGEVTDVTGAVIPNAKVKVIPIIDGKFVEENSLFTTSTEKGEFSFHNVPIGLYEVQITVTWTEIVIKKRVSVTNDKNAKTNLGFTKYEIEPCSDVLETKDLIKDEDRIEIVLELLKSVRTDKKSKLILSTKNIKSQWLGKEEKERFNLMNQAGIQYRADTRPDFEYYKFSTFKVKGTCVEISLDYIWAVGKNSRMIYMSGEGKTFEFRKVDGKWIKRFVSGWIS